MVERILVATDFSTRSDRAMRRSTLIARTTGASLSLVHVVDSDQSPSMIGAERDAALATLEENVRTIEETDGISADARVEVDDVVPGILNAAEAVGAQLIVVGPHRKRLNDIFVGTTAERVVRRSQLPLLVAVQTPSGGHARTLLALDFDEASRAAARAAVELGVFEHTAVIAMHAFDTPARGLMERAMESGDSIDDYVAGEGREGAARLQAFVAELGLPSAAERAIAVQGSPARTILATAVEEGADLIVLGASKRKGFERLLIGSVAEDVLREAHRDILIVPVDDESQAS